jgi:hypothetical protein
MADALFCLYYRSIRDSVAAQKHTIAGKEVYVRLRDEINDFECE